MTGAGYQLAQGFMPLALVKFWWLLVFLARNIRICYGS